MKHCVRCVMPETAESLTFDNEGVCSVCRQIEYKQSQIDWESRMVEFDRILDSFRGRHDYDCIVPFSGGKDSTYTLWYLTRVKKLKCLVVRFDHGFYRPRVEENCLRTLRLLGVDAIRFTPNWQIVRKLMFESLRRRGDFCWHCHTGIFSYPMWIALEKQVPLVIWGEPDSEYSSFYTYEDLVEHDERHFNRNINLGINAEDMLGMLDDTISDYPVTPRDLKPFTFPPQAELRKLKLRSIYHGSYVPWDVRKQVEIIKEELGWQGVEVEGTPPDYNYEKIECMMQGVRDYIKFLKRGWGRTTHLASIDIRNGRLDRETAVKLVETYDGKRPPSLDIFLEILQLDEKSFMEIVAPHVVPPHVMLGLDEVTNLKPNTTVPDFESWPRIFGLPAHGKRPEEH